MNFKVASNFLEIYATRLCRMLGGLCPQSLVLIAILILPLFSTQVQAETTQLSSMRQSFLRLRNIDSHITRRDEWDKLLASYDRYLAKEKLSLNSAVVLFDLGVAYQLYAEAEISRQTSLAQSVSFFDRFATDFPQHELADDALLRAGDLLLHALRDRDQARARYNRLLSDFPESESRVIAQRRLLELEGAPSVRTEATGKKKEPRESDDRRVVVIDPGHGGEDYGAVGKGGILEKDLTLSVALELERILRAALPIDVVLTRRTDTFVPLLERTEIANRNQADVFLSLHSNASERSRHSGFEVFYLDNTGDQSTKRLAERENKSLHIHSESDMDLSFILSDLIQGAKIVESQRLANLIYDSSLSHLKQNYPAVRGLGVKRAPFYVLMGAHMPCVLIEMFFVDHPVDSRKLASPAFRNELAYGIALGVSKFLDLEEVLLQHKSKNSQS